MNVTITNDDVAGEETETIVPDWLPIPEFDSGPDESGSVTLRADGSLIKEFVGETVCVVLCYGFVALAAPAIVRSYFSGRPDWNAIVVLSAFTIGGLVLIRRLLRSLLTFLGPWPVVSLNTPSISLGDTAQLHWRFVGPQNLLRCLEITLFGEEKTYVRCRGRRRAITQTFAQLLFIESANCPLSGDGEVTIPRDTMHSFAADGNAIVWTVQVCAGVAFLPDIVADFPVVVSPQRCTGEVMGVERVEN